MGEKPARMLLLVLAPVGLIGETALGGCTATSNQTAEQAPSTFAPSTCVTEFQPLVMRRKAIIDELAALKRPDTGAIEPGAACVLIRELMGVDGEVARFFSANRRKCAVPESGVEQMKTAQVSDGELARRACTSAGYATAEPIHSF